jgi:ABC-type uncharacterized transport system auxiliary subunit
MTTTSIKYGLCLNLIIASLLLSGCGGPKPYNKNYYVLNVQRSAETTKPDNNFILDVRTFTIDSAFDSKGLVYRTTEFEYETDFYNEFLISPAIMITEKTRTWLLNSGIFERVLDKASYIEPTHTLQANITALYADRREKKAVMEMRTFLISNAAPEDSVIMTATYKASSALKPQAPEALLEAFDACLSRILTDLETDLRQKL